MTEPTRALEQTRQHGWVIVATLVHAALLAALFLVPPRRPASQALQPNAATEISVTLEGEPAPRAPADPDVPTTEPSRTPPERAAARTATGSTNGPAALSSSSPNGNGEAPVDSTLNTGEAPAPAGAGVVPIPMSSAQLGQLGLGGIGAGNPFLPRTEEKVPTSGPNTPAAQAMRGTGLAHDRALGLGPEGPVIRALSEATTASVAPLRGRAVFIVRSGGDGMVVGIDVIDAEGGSGWSDAGKIALEAMRGKKLTVPRGANGLSMRIEVSSDMKLPNGQSAPFGIRSGESGMSELTMPDVSNIGSKPRRVVHSRVVSTEVL